MLASFVLASAMMGQLSGTPAPNLPPIPYRYIARDPAIEAAMRAYCMSPSDGMMNRNGTTGLAFRPAVFPLGMPSGIYFIRPWPTSLTFP